MLSQQNLLVNAMQAAPILQLRPGDRCLHVAPMFHIADWCMAVGMLLMAGTNYFLPAFEPEAVMATIEREKIQRMLMVPTMINRVVHDPTLANYNLQSLEGVLYGASPMPEAVIRKALEALPSTRFYQAYGQTEAAPILTMLAPEYHTVDPASPFAGKLTSAGQAIPGVEVTVLDENDQPVPRAPSARSVPGVRTSCWAIEICPSKRPKPSRPAGSIPGTADGWTKMASSILSTG